MDMKQLIGKMDEIEEGAKPDFLDMDKDGDKEEPMKKAAADSKKNVTEIYTGRETKEGTWRVFKTGDPVAVAGPFKSKEEASAWIKKQSSVKEAALENQGMNESLVVQADGEEAAALLGMLKLAGMAPQHEEPAMEERDVEYTNTPDERIAPHQAAVPAGNDLNKSKTMIKRSYRQGDNPFAMAETAMLEKKLRGMFESMLSENSK